MKIDLDTLVTEIGAAGSASDTALAAMKKGVTDALSDIRATVAAGFASVETKLAALRKAEADDKEADDKDKKDRPAFLDKGMDGDADDKKGDSDKPMDKAADPVAAPVQVDNNGPEVDVSDWLKAMDDCQKGTAERVDWLVKAMQKSLDNDAKMRARLTEQAVEIQGLHKALAESELRNAVLFGTMAKSQIEGIAGTRRDTAAPPQPHNNAEAADRIVAAQRRDPAINQVVLAKAMQARILDHHNLAAWNKIGKFSPDDAVHTAKMEQVKALGA